MKEDSVWKKQDRPLTEYPIGTKARESWSGGYWIKTNRGWKWFVGDTFPRPGTADEFLTPLDPTPKGVFDD